MTLLIGFPGCLVTSFIQGGFLHIVMEYAENGDLCQAIDKKVIPIILSVCEREGGGGGGQCVLALSLPSPPLFLPWHNLPVDHSSHVRAFRRIFCRNSEAAACLRRTRS